MRLLAPTIPLGSHLSPHVRTGNVADSLDSLREFLTENDREHYGQGADADQGTCMVHVLQGHGVC